MIRFASLVLRLIVILIAYVAAVFCASLFLIILLLAGLQPQTESDVVIVSAGLFVGFPLLMSLIGYYSFLPAMAVVLAAELFGKRDWLLHVASAALIALAIISWRWNLDPDTEFHPGIAAAITAAGIVGGWIYWLLAGRRAGLWQGHPETSDS